MAGQGLRGWPGGQGGRPGVQGPARGPGWPARGSGAGQGSRVKIVGHPKQMFKL